MIRFQTLALEPVAGNNTKAINEEDMVTLSYCYVMIVYFSTFNAAHKHMQHSPLDLYSQNLEDH